MIRVTIWNYSGPFPDYVVLWNKMQVLHQTNNLKMYCNTNERGKMKMGNMKALNIYNSGI